MAYTFNTDLLLSEADRAEAKSEFPSVYFGLDNEILREAFLPYDSRANIAKTRSRRWGVFAVLLATGALLLAGGELLFHGLPKNQVRLIAGIGGIAGIVSVVIGVFGVMYRSRKDRWLKDRLATERLRQLHFQNYIYGAQDILSGIDDQEAENAFLRKRLEGFDTFSKNVLQNLEKRLHHIVHSEDPGEGILVDSKLPNLASDHSYLNQYFNAYEVLRFNRQIGYCDLLLRRRKGFWKHAPVRQAQILAGIAMACVLSILLLHGLVFLGAIANVAWMKGPLVHVFAIWAAIIALTARTFEEGFQPEREIERMRQYRLSLKRIYNRFKNTSSPMEKLEAMEDLEKLAYEEMVLFLKSNYEAKFVM